MPPPPHECVYVEPSELIIINSVLQLMGGNKFTSRSSCDMNLLRGRRRDTRCLVTRKKEIEGYFATNRPLEYL